MHIRTRTLIFVTFAFYTYEILGGLMFHHLEYPTEQREIKQLQNLQVEFLRNNTCVDEAKLRKLLTAVIQAKNNGISVLKLLNSNLTTSNWDYSNSVFFATTVSTTIGYGKLAPSTTAGRVACAVYAIIGIPFMMVVIGALGNRMRVLQGYLLEFTRCQESTKIKNFTLCSLMVIGFSCTFLLPALMFSEMEEWSYSETLYYCFITLSTIGFGDYTPGLVGGTNQNQATWYHILTTVWILLGLTWMSGVISAIQKWLEKGTSTLEQTIKTEPEDGIITSDCEESNNLLDITRTNYQSIRHVENSIA